MKKLFTLVAAAFVALTMNAADITCAAAVEAGNALGDNVTDSTQTYSVVGYVSIAEPWSANYQNQNFYMADDSASTSKAFEAYATTTPTDAGVKRGDKVRVTGYMTKYVSQAGVTQIEIKNGTCEILQAAQEEGPKEIKLYTVSEFIAAYDAGTIIEGDSCKVVGVISKWYSKSSKFDQYHSVSYFITDGKKEFEMYNSYSINGAKFETYEYTNDSTATCIDENGLQLQIGDSVIGIGTAKKYGETYEFGQNCYLVWTNAEGGASIETPDLVFEATDFAGLGKAATQTEPGGDVLLVKEGVTFHCDNAYGTDTYGVRCYKDGNLTISADTIIGKIAFELYGTYTGGLDPVVFVNDTIFEYTLPSQARMTTISIFFGEVEIPEVEVLSVAEALAIGALMDSTQVSDKLIIEGYVTQIDDNSFATQYKNMTFWIADEKGTAATNAEGALEIYRGKPDVELVVGDKVRVEGTIVNFKESVIETKSGAAVTKIAEEGIENIVLTEQAQKVMVDGVLYIVRDGKMFNVQGVQVR